MSIFSDLSFLVSLPTIVIVIILAIMILRTVIRTIIKIIFLVILIILALFFWSGVRPTLQDWVNSGRIQQTQSIVESKLKSM